MTDLTSATVTADGVAYAARTRLRAFTFVNGATGGDIVFRDGGASGTVKLTVATPAVAGFQDLSLAGSGILFESDMHVTVGDASSVTVMFG